MASTYKSLGQSKPSAANLTDLYTVPALTSCVLSHLVVCNQSATATTFRVAITPGGGTVDTKNYHYYDTAIEGNETKVVLHGATMAATDKLRVYATLATVSFSASGVELT